MGVFGCLGAALCEVPLEPAEEAAAITLIFMYSIYSKPLNSYYSQVDSGLLLIINDRLQTAFQSPAPFYRVSFIFNIH